MAQRNRQPPPGQVRQTVIRAVHLPIPTVRALRLPPTGLQTTIVLPTGIQTITVLPTGIRTVQTGHPTTTVRQTATVQAVRTATEVTIHHRPTVHPPHLRPTTAVHRPTAVPHPVLAHTVAVAVVHPEDAEVADNSVCITGNRLWNNPKLEIV